MSLTAHKETDLYQPVRDAWSEAGYEVRAEVDDCDIVACRDDIWVIIELKLRLNLDVILQAVERQRRADEVWIAVPRSRQPLDRSRWRRLIHLLRRLELGLMMVDLRRQPAEVQIVLEAEPFDRERSRQNYRRRQTRMRSEFAARHGDHNTGGSTGRQLMTQYREQALLIAALLREGGPSSPASLRQSGSCEQTQRILYNNHYRWFERSSRGVYALTSEGAAALDQHASLVTTLLEQVRNRDNKKTGPAGPVV